MSVNSSSSMDLFCGSTFWDSNLTWYTDDPELTPCFEKTVLVWIPCAFLWCFSLFDIYYIISSKERNIPWNYINISKLSVTSLLIIIALADLGNNIQRSRNGEDVYDVDYYSPAVQISTFIVSAALVYYNKRHGLRASGVLFFFWLLLTMSSIPRLRSEIRQHISQDSNPTYTIISYLIYFPLVVIMFLLNCFADAAPEESSYAKHELPCPEKSKGFPSRLTFSWFDPMMILGYKRPLVQTDLWSLNPEDSSKEVVPLFDKYWNRSVNAADDKRIHQAITLEALATDKIHKNVSNNKNTREKRKYTSILPSLCYAFGGPYMFGSVLKLANDLIMFLNPQLLRLIISFVEGDESMWKGYLYALLLFLNAVVQTLLLAHYFNRMLVVGMKVRTALISAIYRKALRISSSVKKETTVGEIVNLMSVDANRFTEMTMYLSLIWSAPLQIALSLYFLWGILGPSVLAGLGVMLVLIPINAVVANKLKNLQFKQMKFKDERVKLMNEVLSGIKVLKMYAWEPSFEEQIKNIRDMELKVLKQAVYLRGLSNFIWASAPFLVSLSTFACYVLISEENVLDSQTAFVSLSLFNILQFPLSSLPMVISNIVQTSVSVTRINKFLNAEELRDSSVTHNEKESHPLVIERGTFTWGSNTEAILNDITLSIPSGSLVAIVGTVGAGKSSLLSAFLGEMNKISGRVNTRGSIAYVSQQAWIQNNTVQDNILFGKSLEADVYKNVIDNCALTPDLQMLPGGDQTEIGEKGINISGGQKQRVSLARAVYADKDIYFLDDPLSAVDSHVGKHIFEKVIGPNGMLRNKTRLWVTHSITHLPQADNIVVLKMGRVSECGSYAQLLQRKGAFAEFLLQHITELGSVDETEIMQILKKPLDNDFQHQLQRAISVHSEKIDSDCERKSTPAGERSDSFRRRRRITEPTPDSAAELKENNKIIDVEKMETGNVSADVYKHYVGCVGLGIAMATLFATISLQGFQIGSNLWLAVWANDNETVVDGVADITKRNTYLGVYGFLGLGQALTSIFSGTLPFLGCWKAAKIMHNLLLHGVMRLPLWFFDTTPQGRILARFSKDIDALDMALPQNIADYLLCLMEVLATIIVISIVNPIFIAAVIPVGIIYVLIQRFYIRTLRQLKRLESVSRSPIYSHFGETVTGAQTIRAYGVMDRFILESESRVDLNQACFFPSCIANRWLAVRLEMIGNFIIFFAAISAVLSRNTANAGLVALSITYALQVTQYLNWLVRMTSEVEANIVAVERIKEYAEAEQEPAWHIEETAPEKSWPETGAVRMEELSLGYRRGGAAPALRRVTCNVRAGEKVGIVGRTGAGKSTFTLGLFRIIETLSGKILIDDVDVSKLGLHQLRGKITIIPQDPVLFSGTIRMNLDPFKKHNDSDLWRALELAHLKSFVKGFPAGLMETVSEGGESLSVGQRQLVCLARALLRRTRLLVLDEATAAVDLETDDLIQKTIRSEFSHCTILTIAHRLNTIMDSNRVMVLEKGCLVEFASPHDLLKDRTSIFYGMAKDAGLVN